MSQISRPYEGGQVGSKPPSPPNVVPYIVAGGGVRSKIAAIVARDFSVTPLKILAVGDSNLRGGYYSNNSTTQRLSFVDRLLQYINAPATGFTTLKRPYEGGYYVPFGPTPQTNHYEEVGNVRCQNSSNWIKAAPPISGLYVGGCSSFVKDPASAGYASMRIDRRQSTYAQFAGKHDFEMTATRMKLFHSIGQTATTQIDRTFGNTSMATGASDSTVAGNGFHGTLDIEFYDLVGAATISTTSITATTSNSRGMPAWMWTSNWITLPNSGTYPWVEIRVKSASGLRMAASGIYFDDGSPRVQVMDASYPGGSIASNSPITYNQTGVATDTSFTARRNYIHGIRAYTSAALSWPMTFDATDYTLTGAPTNYPLFSGGMDVLIDGNCANDIANDTPAKIKAELLATMAEFVVDNPNGIYIKTVILRGMGPLASLDSYVAGTATVGGVANQSWAGLQQAYRDVMAAYPNNFALMDLNSAINDKFFSGVQPSATVLNNTIGIYSASDGLHTDPWVEDTIALATSMFLSGKI